LNVTIFDVLRIFESNCSLITEWTTLVAAHMECPEELREAAAGSTTYV
jgi:hypothetical protein